MASASITPSGSGSSLTATDMSSAGATSFGSPDSLHPDQWTTQQVVRWLGSLTPSNLAKLYSNTFVENDIVGEVLIQLDSDALKDLGFSSVGHRLALLKAIYELKIKWDVEIDGEDWKPSQTQQQPGAAGYAAAGGMLRETTIANVSAISMLRALQERDERVRALELELARLEDWLIRWTNDPSKTDSLPPYFPPSRVYCTMPDGLSFVDERRSSSAHQQNPDRLPPSAFSGPVTAISSAGMEANTYDDVAARGRKASASLTPSSSTFNMHHQSGNTSQLMELSPTSSNATPSATPTSAHHPMAIAAAGDSPLMHRVMSPNTAVTTSQGNAAVAAAAAAAAAAATAATTSSSSSSYASANRPLHSSGGEPSSPHLSASNNPNAVDGAKERTATAASAASSSSSADAPYKSFRVTLDDPCHKVLPAALKKYKINDDWRQYALFICYGTTERCLSYDEKPLLLFQKLKEAKQSPVFMLRHIRDVKSPIAIASAKAAARKTATAAEAAKITASSKNNSASSSWNSSGSYMSGAKVTGGGNKGDDGAKEEKFVDSPPGQPKISGPASQLAESSSSSGKGGGEAESEDTFAVSIYPYVSEREDEFDVSVGDTFVVKSKAKGWWIVQRDVKASGQADVVGVVKNADGTSMNGGEIQSGWVPAGCLLETKQPLSTIVPSSIVSQLQQQDQLLKEQSPATPGEGTFSHQQQQPNNQAAAASTSTEEDAKTPKPTTLSSAMANAPIPPSLITSTSTPGLLLMDYNAPEEKIHLPKDTRLRVFKRYNHWSYCVDVGPGHSRAWLPSWYIGKVGTRSNSTNSRSTGAEGRGGSAGGAGGESRNVSVGSTAGAPSQRSAMGVDLI